MVKAPGSGEGPVSDQSPEGKGVDDLAVARFVAELHDSGAFAEVKLTSSIIKEVAVGVAREYQVDCRL